MIARKCEVYVFHEMYANELVMTLPLGALDEGSIEGGSSSRKRKAEETSEEHDERSVSHKKIKIDL